MQTFLPYLLKAAACLAVFWTFFRVMLSRTTLYRFNRLVLLAGTALAMLLPLCVITRYREIPVMPELPQVVSAAPAPEVSAPAFSWQTVAAVLFGAGAVATGLHTLWSLGCVARLVGRGRRERLTDGVVLVRTSRAVSPFSWGRYIVLPERLEAADEASILLHERAHLRLGHTFDLLWMDAVCLLQWFNPAVWLLRRELREVHEYEADAAVLAAGADARAYQMLLIKEAAGGRWYSVANSFNHSKIKKRITMMLKEKSNSWARLKLVLLIPVAACSMLAFARPDVNRELTNLVQSEGTTISSADQPYTRELFDREIDRYIEEAGGGKLSGTARFEFMKAQTKKADFFINARDQILYNNEFAEMSEMPALLKTTLSESSGGKPVMIYFLCDKHTSDAAVEKALEIAGKAFAGYQATEAGKNVPTLFFFGDPRKDYPPKGK